MTVPCLVENLPSFVECADNHVEMIRDVTGTKTLIYQESDPCPDEVKQVINEPGLEPKEARALVLRALQCGPCIGTSCRCR